MSDTTLVVKVKKKEFSLNFPLFCPAWPSAWLNSFVHVWMYLYYFLSTFGNFCLPISKTIKLVDHLRKNNVNVSKLYECTLSWIPNEDDPNDLFDFLLSHIK